MELKDVILSTIAELGEEASKSVNERLKKESAEASSDEQLQKELPKQHEVSSGSSDAPLGEREFLESLRERILVLFEGFQSPNNKRVEAKIDLTLNFLEYLLATLDERIDTLKKL